MRARLFAVLLTLACHLPSANADELIVGANIGNVPWEFADRRGNFVGFEIDLITEIAERLGHRIEILNIPFNGLFSAVQSGRIDVALSSVTITEKRLGSVSFAQPYYDSAQSLTVGAYSNVSGLDDLKGAVIGVDTGSTGDMWTTTNSGRYGFGDIRRYEGLAPAMLDLQSRRIDAYISDIPSLLYFVKDKPQYRVIERIETGERYSMMFARDSEWTQPVNDVISKLKEEGFVAALHQRWFGAEPAAESSTVQVVDRPVATP
ncbi:MAG: transporter substrate-binding domain-containing protein [Pseudomonadota bacterium]